MAQHDTMGLLVGCSGRRITSPLQYSCRNVDLNLIRTMQSDESRQLFWALKGISVIQNRGRQGGSSQEEGMGGKVGRTKAHNSKNAMYKL